MACGRGHLHVAQWLWRIGVHHIDEEVAEVVYYYAFPQACANGHFSVVQWLWDAAPSS
jgi:hypothetical protein